MLKILTQYLVKILKNSDQNFVNPVQNQYKSLKDLGSNKDFWFFYLSKSKYFSHIISSVLIKILNILVKISNILVKISENLVKTSNILKYTSNILVKILNILVKISKISVKISETFVKILKISKISFNKSKIL